MKPMYIFYIAIYCFLSIKILAFQTTTSMITYHQTIKEINLIEHTNRYMSST